MGRLIFFVLPDRRFSLIIFSFLGQDVIFFSSSLGAFLCIEAAANDPILFPRAVRSWTGFVSDTFRNTGQLIACLRRISSFSTASSASGRVDEVSPRFRLDSHAYRAFFPHPHTRGRGNIALSGFGVLRSNFSFFAGSLRVSATFFPLQKKIYAYESNRFFVHFEIF